MKCFIAALPVALCLYGCSCSSSVESVPVDTTSINYLSGRDAAARMMRTCGTDTFMMQDFLLDFHVQSSRIATESGEAAARDHRQGFEDELRELSPETAELIF